MDTFKKRLTYGKEAEEYAGKILNDLNIKFQTSKQYWGNAWTNDLDKKYGDILLLRDKDPIWIDVKRNSIPIKTLQTFEGDYYWVFHHDMWKQNVLITKREVLALDMPLYELSSGDPGHKIRDIRGIHRSIEDLLD